MATLIILLSILPVILLSILIDDDEITTKNFRETAKEQKQMWMVLLLMSISFDTVFYLISKMI